MEEFQCTNCECDTRTTCDGCGEMCCGVCLEEYRGYRYCPECINNFQEKEKL